MVLTDPELVKAELLGADDELQILVVALSGRLGRIVVRHDEYAVANCLHDATPWSAMLVSAKKSEASRRQF
jgi:hypothetical protein